MSFACGIVGLPNVGKSTLFNSLSSAKAEAANYPFCTIEPNVGVVTVPDERLDKLVELFKPPKIVPAAIRFVDIAGLVRGASKGEGLGNKFLAHIREVDAILQVVRCFEDANVVHVENRVDPVADIETIGAELCLTDLEAADRRREKSRKMLKANKPEDKLAIEVCDLLVAHLDKMRPVRTLLAEAAQSKQGPLASPEGLTIVRELQLLTAKPSLYVGNVDEGSLADVTKNAHYMNLVAFAEKEGAKVIPICAALESQIAELDPADRPEFLSSAGLKEPGLFSVIRAGYDMLGLITFFTAGDPEVHAWTIPRGTLGPGAAGKIHTDFEKGFIRAEVIRWDDLVKLGSESKCREAGKIAIEGKEYVVKDGDVMHFRFNV
ncbi:MAG: redox-regulated ATPase YchF [Polyangiaceae bacterium]